MDNVLKIPFKSVSKRCLHNSCNRIIKNIKNHNAYLSKYYNCIYNTKTIHATIKYIDICYYNITNNSIYVNTIVPILYYF